MQTDSDDGNEQLWMDEPAQRSSVAFIQWKAKEAALHWC